mmetsp:Transcript_9754/g.19110  ORF Transcript_9754/g.19110 Transcript_9754/m.19110 type:complete len:106 (-) Transcript_9754:2608-2925(-)
MSLGWLTESSIIPQKPKRIEVDSKSFISLKATVLEEQTQRMARPKELKRSSKSIKEILNLTRPDSPPREPTPARVPESPRELPQIESVSVPIVKQAYDKKTQLRR